MARMMMVSSFPQYIIYLSCCRMKYAPKLILKPSRGEMGILQGLQERSFKDPPLICPSQMLQVLPDCWNRAQSSEGHSGAQVPLLQEATLLLSLDHFFHQPNNKIICLYKPCTAIQVSPFNNSLCWKNIFPSFINLNFRVSEETLT